MELEEIEKIEDLLAHWKKFRQSTRSEKLVDFADWLKRMYAFEPTAQTVAPQINEFMQKMPSYAQIGYFWGRLNRYATVWAKKAFADLSIKTTDEFGILMFVSLSANPRKSEVVGNTLLETSTCLEIIKRLVRQGFLNETPDQTDKRSMRISLTPQGAGVLGQAVRKMQEISQLLSADLSELQRQELLRIFHQLDHFHFGLLQKSKDKDWQEIKVQ